MIHLIFMSYYGTLQRGHLYYKDNSAVSGVDSIFNSCTHPCSYVFVVLCNCVGNWVVCGGFVGHNWPIIFHPYVELATFCGSNSALIIIIIIGRECVLLWK